MLNDFDLGALVVLFALPESAILFPELRLRLQEPSAFQALCFDAAMTAGDALYEEKNDLWYIDTPGAAKAFKSVFPETLFDADTDGARFWLKNAIAGYGENGDLLAIWVDAVKKAVLRGYDPAGLPADPAGKLDAFLAEYRLRWRDEDFSAFCDEVQDAMPTERSVAIKAKFILNMSEYHLVGPLVPFYYAREDHILIELVRETERRHPDFPFAALSVLARRHLAQAHMPVRQAFAATGQSIGDVREAIR